ELLRALELRNAGQEIEKIGGVLAEARAAGQQADVRIKPRGGGIIIPRSEMDVAPDGVFVPADDQANLRMDFVAHEAIDDVHAGLFELARPLDVVGLIEARP